MAVINPFKVLTEFKFEVGGAIANSSALQGAVDSLSRSADNALLSFQRLGFGIAAQIGLGTGGLVGFFYKGLQASEKFYQAQLKLSNIMQSNSLFTGENAFEKSMLASEKALMNMQKAAREFSLPATSMVELSSQIGAVLSVKNLDDHTFSKSIDLSRQFLKSAPILGIDPGLAQQQLIGAIIGRAEFQGRLISRLVAETEAMKEFGGTGGLKKFNTMDAAKRLDVLTKALAQFSSNAKVVEATAKSLSGQMQRLKDNLFSMFSIFKPIGDALMEPVLMILNSINRYLEREGEQAVKNVALIVERIFKDPLRLYHDLQQISSFRGNFSLMGSVLGTVGMLEALTHAFFFLNRRGLLGASSFVKALNSVATVISRITNFIMPAVNGGLLAMMGGLLKVSGALLFLFAIISRAMSKAQVANYKWLADNMPRITDLFARFQRVLTAIFLPVRMALEGTSDILAWAFRMDLSGNLLLGIFEHGMFLFEMLGKVIVGVLSTISGLMDATFGNIYNAINFDWSKLFSFAEIKKNFMDGFMRVWRSVYDDDKKEEEDRNTSNKVTNIDKIEIINQFKEQLEPDRIAFTLREQLVKLATNPQQATGRSLRGSAIGN